jgi:hypothetical protein
MAYVQRFPVAMSSGNRFQRQVRPAHSRAFTVTELLFVAGGIALLLLTAAPLLGNSRLRSEGLVCGNNLRQIGVAFQTWADSHEDKIPWLVPQAKGGTSAPGSSLMQNAWIHFLPLSNNLASPRLLACPSDNVRIASKWDQSADGGFINAGYRNNALSYLVGCHGELNLPSSILSTDRNMRVDNVSAGCSIGFQFVAQVNARGFSVVAWTNSIHMTLGNVLQAGGNVSEVNSVGLRSLVAASNNDNGSEHYLMPR